MKQSDPVLKTMAWLYPGKKPNTVNAPGHPHLQGTQNQLCICSCLAPTFL